MKLPQELITSLNGLAGFDKDAFIAVHESGEKIASIRFNSEKLSPKEFEETEMRKVPWSQYGYYLPSRPQFILDPLWHAGAYYVQEASSMFLEQAVLQHADISRPLKVLDLCAAPGGKSTHLQSLLHPESMLVCNEVINQRGGILEENLTRWGAHNIVITGSTTEKFAVLKHFFDVVVVDAPCSGSGLFRKDPEAIKEWSPEQVKRCCVRQKEILQHALECLMPGGLLIYSTCSYSGEENEEVAAWLLNLQMQGLKLDTTAAPEVVEVAVGSDAYGYRFYPDKVEGEGFFLAAFQKPKDGSMHFNATKNKLSTPSRAEIEIIQPWLPKKEGKIFKWKEELFFTNALTFQSLPLLSEQLFIRKAGITIGSIVQQNVIPDPALAYTFPLVDAASPIEADLETALGFLRREAWKGDMPPRGWHLVTYKGKGLGWIKSMGNRVNNYYPKQWRILQR